MSFRLFARKPNDPRHYVVLDERGSEMGQVFVDGDSATVVLHYTFPSPVTGTPTSIQVKKSGFTAFDAWYAWFSNTFVGHKLKVTMQDRGPITPQ
ncbi:MAG: hypothetical protein KBD15_00195 [Candidatus Magasanikbacteria bacterium]|nr:hypothetical protein [Candidatus Magasanikbacteria bacterium]